MRNSLWIAYIVIMACVCGISPADAAERVIRPRGKYGSASPEQEFASAPVSPSPREKYSVRTESAAASAAPSEPLPAETYQPADSNPPPVFHPRARGPRGRGWLPDVELEKQSEFAATGPEREFEPDSEAKKAGEAKHAQSRKTEPEARRGNTAPGITAPGLPALSPDDQDEYRNMNLSRLEFAAPYRITGGIQAVREPAPEAVKKSVRPPEAAKAVAEKEELVEEPEQFIETVEEQYEEPAEELRKEAAEQSAAGKITANRTPEGMISAPAPLSVQEYPTPAEVENYRRRLELRLLEKYNNQPEYAGNIGKVTVVLSKPLQPSLDGTRLRAEFDQLVQDPWGRRIPALEKEYYVVTFGAGGARQVRSDPSIRVGLNLERTYSESKAASGADIAERIRAMPAGHAFRANPSAEVPSVKMPDWWRPEFADEY